MAGQPLICHTLTALAHAGVDQILIAADGEIAELIAGAIGEVRGAEVHLALQPPNDDEATMRAVDRVLGPGPLVFAQGDSLLAGLDLSEVAATADTVVDAETLWRYDGRIDSVLEANTLALDALKRGRVGVDLSQATVQGRVKIDPTAQLDGAKIRGPAYIGPNARVIETYVGPYSSIGEGVVLEGVEIENSIVLPGAQIRYPGRRLEASLVGEGAQIGRDYSLPSALRVRVGPNSEIQLS